MLIGLANGPDDLRARGWREDESSSPTASIIATAFFVLLFSTSFHPDYGHYADEFNYIACAKRPDLGYVDHPPLAPLLLAVNRAVLGDSLPALRILPALCGALSVLLAAWMARRLGGGGGAQMLAALCMTTAPLYLSFFSIFSTNCFEIVAWTLISFVLLELGRSQDQRWWLAIGVLAGIAVMFKHTGAVLIAALVACTVVLPMRRHLLARHFWIGSALALAIVLPNLYWQVHHDWASLDFYAGNDRIHNVPTTILGVLDGQLSSFNPMTFPVWVAGLYFLLFSKSGKPYRLAGLIAALLLSALLLSGKSRTDRIQGIYPLLFAAGAVQLERLFQGYRLGRLRCILPGLLVAVGVIAAPLMLPILRPEAAARYLQAIEDDPHRIQQEVGTARLLLPLAHRSGWDELGPGVARVIAQMSPAERDAAIILAEYVAVGEAIQLLANDPLPPVYSPSLTGYFWGPPPRTPQTVVVVGYEPEQLQGLFGKFDIVERLPCEYCTGWRQDYPIAIARGPLRSLAEAWPDLRTFFGRKQHLLARAGAFGGNVDN
jgi:hypothetical protein